jgi:hypothetical protein
MIESTMYVLAVPNLETSATYYYRYVLGFQIHQMGDPGWRMSCIAEMVVASWLVTVPTPLHLKISIYVE